MSVCLRCGTPANPGQLFCTHCGYTLPQETGPIPPSSPPPGPAPAVPAPPSPAPSAPPPPPPAIPSAIPARPCPRCGAAIALGAVYCPVCQSPVSP
ncbi:MAG: zinc ribbon domain-containing protein [Thermoplasmata archaeon]